MRELNYIYKLLSISLVAFSIENTIATEETNEKTKEEQAAAKQISVKPQPEQPAQLPKEKVEPYGLESGKIVDVPANLADKVGKKINELLEKEENH